MISWYRVGWGVLTINLYLLMLIALDLEPSLIGSLIGVIFGFVLVAANKEKENYD